MSGATSSPANAPEFSDDVTEQIVLAARQLRHQGKYYDAIKRFEEAIEHEGDSDVLWGELASTQYQEWHQLITQLHKPAVVAIAHLDSDGPVGSPLGGSLLQRAYNSFIVAMEYPANKKQPALLIKMVMLYLEFRAYRGALSVCTLLVEGYANHPSIQESILLCAVSARALEKHQESAQYLRYLVEKPPLRLSSYHMLLLAGLELEKANGMRDEMRETYAQAYKAMIGLSPVTSSEKAAHHIYKTSHKNESQRVQLWFQDDTTWLDMATKLMNLNFPIFVCDVIDVVHKRGHALPREMLVIEGIARFRIGEVDRASEALVTALQLDYWSEHYRFLLARISEAWKQQFANEQVSATRIQHSVRRHWMRVTWKAIARGLIEDKRRRAAVLIQCAWRQHTARLELAKLMDARRKREIAENDLLAAEDWLLIMRQLNSAATTIQSLHKIFLAKRDLRLRRALRNKHNNLLSAFAIHRSAASQKRIIQQWVMFVRLQKDERWDAAYIIQCQVRVFLSRRLLRRLLQARTRQEHIIALCLGKRSETLQQSALQHWQHFTVDRCREKKDAARRIQEAWRRHLARKRYRHELRRHLLATDLMHRMLADKATQRLRTTWSALATNALFHRMQKHRSAVVIQRHARGMIARRVVRKLRSRRRRVAAVVNAMRARSAKQLARRVFDSFVRFVEMQWELRDTSAIVVQRIFRGFAARKRVRFLAECNRILKEPGMTLRGKPDAYVKRVCFLLLARLPEQNRMDRRHAATRILKWYLQARRRRRLVMALSKLRRQRAILNTLQATFRTMALLFFKELKQRIQARRWRHDRMARRIQRAIRIWLTYRRYCRVLRTRDSRKARAAAHALQRQLKLLGRCLREWHSSVRAEKDSRRDAAVRVQRMYRARIAQRQARRELNKRAARARVLESLHLKPLERCFRRWEECMLEKATLIVRTAAKTHSGAMVSPDKWRTATKWDQQRPGAPLQTLEQRAQLPSLLFYTLLNRVRQSGILQLSFAGGMSSLSTPQLQQLLALASSVIVDGGGAQLVEQVVAAMASLERPGPAQKLIFYNARLSAAHAASLQGVLAHPGSAVTSLVLCNVPLTTAAVAALATSVCHGHSRLEQLVLEACGVGNAGAAALAEALAHSRTLWKLDLSQNHVGDAAAPALARAIVSAASLRVLSLAGNALSDRGVLVHVAPALAHVSREMGRVEAVVLRGMPRISARARDALQQAATTRSGLVLLD